MPHQRITKSVWLLTALVAVYSVPASGVPAPIIGILTTPSDGSVCETVASEGFGNGMSCFAAFYVKWLEASGMRVAVIPYDAPAVLLDQFLASVNGILFTGGGLSLAFNTTYYQTALYLYKGVLAANDAGHYFPLWGTCMGFQLLNILTSGSQDILDRYAFDSENISLPLDLVVAPAESRILGSMPAHILEILVHENVTVNLHHDGVTPASFYSNDILPKFYRLLATSRDRKNKVFNTLMEALKYPIYGAQFHPERPQFEYTPLDIPHTYNAVQAMQYLGNFFASEARKSENTFVDADLLRKAIIYAYNPVLDASGSSYQFYVFA